MTLRFASILFSVLFAVAGYPLLAEAQGAPATTTIPPDPWPRVIDLSNGQVLVYQPQINSWNGNQLDFRAALAIKPDRLEGRELRRGVCHRPHTG